MRDDMDHFFVGQIVGGAALCGPLVVPAKTPCKSCIEIGTNERYGIDELEPVNSHCDELPVSVGYQVAGVATQAVLQLIDTGSSEFIGSQLTFDYLSPVIPSAHASGNECAHAIKCECGVSTGNFAFY
jgi:hypothetical protein